MIASGDPEAPSSAPAPAASQADPKLASPQKTPQAQPTSPEAKIAPLGPTVPRASSTKESMKNSSAAETAAVGCVIAGLGVIIFVPTPIGTRLIALAIYLAVAFGIWKMSRIAAIIGLVIACANVVVAVYVVFNYPSAVDPKKAPVLIFMVLWIKWLYQAVASTFAYHRSLSAKL